MGCRELLLEEFYVAVTRQQQHGKAVLGIAWHVRKPRRARTAGLDAAGPTPCECPVSDDPNGKKPDLEHVWSALAGQGYALTSEDKIGLPEKFRENFVQTYFTEDQHPPRPR